MTNVRRCLVVAVLGAAVVAPVSNAQAVAPRADASCQGHAATIVGSPHRGTLTGTPGDDIMVSNGSSEVVAGDGDDLVCLTGRAPTEDGYQWLGVDGGTGDDHVTASFGKQDVVLVSLGAGADSFTGGRESDFVAGGVFESDEQVASDSEADVIDTGPAGFDIVVVGDRGPLADSVHVRSPAAHVWAYASGLVGAGSLTGGPRSTLTVVDDSVGADGAWTLDLAAGTASLEAAPVLSWTGFSKLVWAVPGTLDVQGTDGADAVTGPVVSGNLGAGDDTIYAWSSKADHGAHTAPLDGGAGSDQVRFFAGAVYSEGEGEAAGGGVVPFTPSDVTVDVAHGRTMFGDGEVVSLAGFEWYGAQTNRVATLVGSSRDDVLYGSACDLRMSGGAGDDRLRQVPNVDSAGFTEPTCGDRGGGRVAHLSGGSGDDTASVAALRSTVVGGPGDDHLMGGSGRDQLSGGAGDDRLVGDDRADVLVGGEGRDLARGGRGEDTCRAEYGSSCELPRSATHLGAPPPGSHPSAVRLVDPRGDVSYLADPRHPHGSTPAPDVRAGDVVAVRTTYRHGQVTFATRFRSLPTTDELLVYIDFRYANSIQFLYGDVGVVVPPHGPARATAQGDTGRCRPDLALDRARAVVTVSLDASCLDGAPWVRAAVRSYTTDDADAPSYYNLDEAPDQAGQMERYGPAAWARMTRSSDE